MIKKITLSSQKLKLMVHIDYFTVVVRMMVIMNIYLHAYPFKENVKK